MPLDEPPSPPNVVRFQELDKWQALRIGASSHEKQARLAELRRQLETAKGDQRKALLIDAGEKIPDTNKKGDDEA